MLRLVLVSRFGPSSSWRNAGTAGVRGSQQYATDPTGMVLNQASSLDEVTSSPKLGVAFSWILVVVLPAASRARSSNPLSA